MMHLKNNDYKYLLEQDSCLIRSSLRCFITLQKPNGFSAIPKKFERVKAWKATNLIDLETLKLTRMYELV